MHFKSHMSGINTVSNQNTIHFALIRLVHTGTIVPLRKMIDCWAKQEKSRKEIQNIYFKKISVNLITAKRNPDQSLKRFCGKWNNSGKETQIIHLRGFTVNGITAKKKTKLFISDILR